MRASMSFFDDRRLLALSSVTLRKVAEGFLIMPLKFFLMIIILDGWALGAVSVFTITRVHGSKIRVSVESQRRSLG